MTISLFARLAQRHAPTTAADRRRFLQASLAASSGLLLSNLPAAWARSRPMFGSKRIVVIGGGFSGLVCAYELKASGHDVSVIESSNRVGGRVLSFNKANGNEFVPGRNVEGGGELIGSNHPLWVGYKEKFGLSFLDVHESGEAEFPLLIGGKVIAGEESSKLYEEMDAALNLMSKEAALIDADAPWTAKNAAALDKRTIADWIKSAEISDLAKAGITAQLSGDNGVPTDRASYLGMLTSVKGGNLDDYWTQSEVFRCAEGNQRLALELAKELGDRVFTRLSARTIELKADRCIITCSDGRTIECDECVLAVPPSAWQRIEIKPGLPTILDGSRGVPMGVQMGTNVKYLSHVKRRFWWDKNLDPAALTDQEITWTWDATDGQDALEVLNAMPKPSDTPVPAGKLPENDPLKDAPGQIGKIADGKAEPAGAVATSIAPPDSMVLNPADRAACLSAFSGGPAAERIRAKLAKDRTTTYADLLEKIYPGYKDNLVEARFMDWPGFPFIGAGYSFPAPGQVTTAGPLLAKPHGGRLHFAGEHCCYKFVGYMEGALQSGAAVARRINGA